MAGRASLERLTRAREKEIKTQGFFRSLVAYGRTLREFSRAGKKGASREDRYEAIRRARRRVVQAERGI